jgi:GT2 family glycosyltransferase
MINNKLRCFWFGYGGHSHTSDFLRPILQKLGHTLTTIHEWQNADIKYKHNTILNHLKQADVILLTNNYKLHICKSNNKLTQALSLGIPVICHPLLAYKEIEQNYPGCCLFAETEEDWIKQIKFLESEENRKQISEKALIAAQDYTIEKITKKWINVFFNKCKKIDIIIPTYNNFEYLKLCIESIKKNTYYSYNIIVSDAGSNLETWDLYKTLSNVIVVGDKNIRKNFSQACNDVINKTNSQYFSVFNSDVIVSKNWDKNIIEKFLLDDKIAAVNPLSNCDQGFRHNIQMKVSDSFCLHPGMKIQQIKDINELYEYMNKSNCEHKEIYQHDWLPFYATTFRREYFEKTGKMDPNFLNGNEDLDMSIRLQKNGYKMIETYDSFIFHFGGCSRTTYRSENEEKYEKQNKANYDYLNKKWGTKWEMA